MAENANTFTQDWNLLKWIKTKIPEQYANLPLANIPNTVLSDAVVELKKAIKDNTVIPTLSESFRNRILNIMYGSSGRGGYYNQFQTFMTALDRFDMNNIPINTEYSGLTFMTRPRLCLTSSNLRTNRRMTPLDTLNPRSTAFAIRCLLDTHLYTINNKYKDPYLKSQLFDANNPFLVPVCNAMHQFSGAPDISISYDSTAGGYHQEAQTFATGSDDLQRSGYTLTLQMKDVQYGPLTALFYYWLEYIRCVTRGSMLAYADDVDEQRMNYTVSIYRFLLDPSKRYITKWAKFTGCFPYTLPIGGMFQKSVGDTFVKASTDLSINFMCNKVEYMDYAILMDFNSLVRRYVPDINKDLKSDKSETNIIKKYEQLPMDPISNYKGIPYITSDPNGYKLLYRRVPPPASIGSAIKNQGDDLLDQILFLDYAEKMNLNMKNSTFNNEFKSLETYLPSFNNTIQQYRQKNMSLDQFFAQMAHDTAAKDTRALSPINI